MSAGKRLLSSAVTTAVVRALIKPYRALMFAGFRLEKDPRLVALMRTREPAVFLMWHQDFVHTIGYLSHFRLRRPMVVLASASRDGSIAAAAAAGSGFAHVTRGSSAKRGAGGLLGLMRLSQKARRYSVMVVADGPRPPARELKPGGLLVARDAGLPIWLVRTSWHPETVLSRSWARFHVPRPWSRGVVLADGPFTVPADADRDALDRLRVDLEARLRALADRGDRAARARWGGAGESAPTSPRTPST